MGYKAFIDNILQTRGRFMCGNQYHERHHIVPRCIGGSENTDNLIDLYAREHFIAHRLLAIENAENEKLVYAWWCMCSLQGSSKKRNDVTEEEYEEARIQYAKKFSGGNNPSAKRVVRVCDETIYDTLKSCYIDNNISNNTLYEMLKQHRKFVYYDEWINMSEDERVVIKSMDLDLIQHINRSDAAKKAGSGGSVSCAPSTRAKIGEANKKHGVRVYCPELDEEFITIKYAADKYNVSKVSIGYCLCGKQKHAGKHPVTGVPLTWERLENKNS